MTGIFSREPEYTWAETKELLDDPHVSAETKQAVLKHYSLRGDNDSAADAYYEKYNVRPGWADPIWDDRRRPYDRSADPYEDARAEAEEKGYRSSQIESELDENRGKLDEATLGTGSTGYTTSDELLELAKDGLDTFHKFLPIDAQVPADSQHIDGPLDYASDIRERYWEQAGIDFQKFLDDADALRKAHGTLSELRSSTEDDLNALYRDWTGDAANASYQKYSEDIDPPAKDLVSHVEGAAAVIERAVESVFNAVRSKAEEVTRLYSPTVGAATPEIAQKVVTLARGEFDSQDQVLEVAAWIDAQCGTNIESTMRHDNCDLNDENKQLVIRECKAWIRESWNVDLYDNLYSAFTSLCDSTKEAVDEAYTTLNKYLGEYSNDFPSDGAGQGDPQNPGAPGGSHDPGIDAGAGPGTGNGSGAASGTGTSGVGGSGAGTGGPGGGSGAGTSPSAPSMPKIDTPQPDLDGLTPGRRPDGRDDGKPGAGTPDVGDILGEGSRDDGTDGTADPGFLRGDDEQGTLTVEQGDKKLEIGEPDAEGRMGITVDDGSGEPAQYELDFGTGDRDARTADDGDAEGGEFGPQGGDPTEKVYRPGPDGKIRIEDGNLTIVAEQPEGPDGPTLVTVDDGTGEPTTYTLDGFGDGDTGSDIDGLRALPAQPPATEDGIELPDPFGGGTSDSGADSGAGSGAGSSADVQTPSAPSTSGSLTGSLGGGGDVGGAGGGIAAAAPGADAQPLDEGSRTSATTGTPGGGGAAPAAPAPGGAPAAAGASGGGGGMMGGGMMGAPMGAAGAGAGQGGEQNRSASYRIDGQLFDGSETPKAISGTIGEERQPPVKYDK